MIFWGAAVLLLALVDTPAGEAAPIRSAQLTLREQILVRVPARTGPAAPSTRIEWKEGKKVQCIPASAVSGATFLGRDRVDLLLRDKRRVRAKLETSCPALDYYRGFYISPDPKGMICADRQSIRSRMGGECQIDALRMLKPVKAR